MKNKHLLFILCLFAAHFLDAQISQNFTMRQVKCGMEMPWEITYGPDNAIWATESRGYRVSRINPQTGISTVILDLSNNKNFPNYPSVSPQGGLMGLALHPNLLTGKPFVYLAYVYRYDGGAEPTGYFFKTKVVRYTYNSNAQTLTNEEVMCDTIPGSSDHNGGRMTIANVGGTPYLFYGVGDMGGGQFANANRPNKSQDRTSYEGKILRFNIEPDADSNATDKWIPNDGNNTFGRAVYSIGHRNPQGLVAGLNGNLYQSEHGPYSDDELNLINGTGRNYGHPLVVGSADGNYNGAAVGAGTGVPPIVNEVANATSLGANYRNPLKSFFPVANATIRENYINAVNNTPPVPNYFLSWNSIAPSGIDYYNSTAIPNWQNSILITSLKRRRVYRLQLDATGTAIVGDTIPLFADFGRFRDVCISPDGTKIYVSCDSEGQTSGPTAGTTIDPPNKGCILEFTYVPIALNCAFNNCPSNQNFAPTGNTQVVTWVAPTLSNCNANTTVSSNYASGVTFNAGTTTVTYTATSGGATVATCSFNITVNPILNGANCASKSSAPWNEWISNVSLNTLNNTSEKVRTDRYVVGYSDWTDKTTTLLRGQSYPLSITPSLGYIGNLPQQFCRVWIDFNDNAVYEDSELVLERTNIIPFASTVVVPATAVLGTTRMRVSLKNGSYPMACESFPNGEVEDYSIVIGAATSCIPPILMCHDTTVTIAANLTSATIDIRNLSTLTTATNGCFIQANSYSFIDGTLTTSTPTLPIGTTAIFRNHTYQLGGGVASAAICSSKVTVNQAVTSNNYCASKASLPWEYAVSNVKLNTLNNTSDKFKDITQLGYSDYLNLSTPLNKGQTYPLSITPVLSWIGNLPNTYCRVWIDFNQNKAFEANELVLEKTNQNPFMQSILIPNSAISGTTRMRVSLKNGAYPTACEAFEKGEVEDYTITITEGGDSNLPDLYLSNLSVTTPIIKQGEILTYKFDFGNLGTIALSHNIKIYVSLDNVLDNNDIEIYLIANQGGIGAGVVGINPAIINLPLPNTVPVGQYFLIGKIDGSNVITESNENNNVSASSSKFIVNPTTTGGNDIALSITTDPSVYKPYTRHNFRITATNTGNTVFTNVKIKFLRPAITNGGGTKTASIGSFQDYCANGLECSEWTIPTFAAGTTATLDAPVFILNPTGQLVATASLTASTPVDNTAGNNTASISVSPSTPTTTQPLASRNAPQLIPITIKNIYPSPTDSYLEVTFTSTAEKSVKFSIMNAMGQTVLIQPIVVDKGMNKAFFDVSKLPQGLYFIHTNMGKGRDVRTKFIKM